MTTTDTHAIRYWTRGGMRGRAIGVMRQHPDGRAQSWAWGRWVDIPPRGPDLTDIMVDEVTEAEALATVHSDLFEVGDLPDPQAKPPPKRRASTN